MMMAVVFSFLLNTWKSFPEVDFGADEHGDRVKSLIAEIVKEEQILCSLERHHLLSYDGQWRKQTNLKIPKECENQVGKQVLAQVEVRSETLPPNHDLSAWDHKVQIKAQGDTSFSLYTRQDKKYVGAHSTAGWSMWIERKTGNLRYEWSDPSKTRHFRMIAKVNMNPVKGGVSKVHDLQALFVNQAKNKVQKAVVISGNSAEGFKYLSYQRSGEQWIKSTERCSRSSACKVSGNFSMDEEKLRQFADVSSKKYTEFLEKARPLAFASVEPEELVPPMAHFR
ncbi:hypothetical protein [Bdellovibrio bacteriovorus]|uniref:hypothetical protein n=1 Tax=Bdellovibrio TaxID=958 RepID=UPI0035A90140